LGLLTSRRLEEYSADTILFGGKAGYDAGVGRSESVVSTTILIASAHPIIRNSLRLLVERDVNFHVVAEAANGREAVVLADYKRPNIILLDMKMPQLNGIAAAREISAKRQTAGIIFVTAETDELYVSEAFKAGAAGYVSADTVQTDLCKAINAVKGGHSFVSPSIGNSKQGGDPQRRILRGQ
jgi:DNA-binding NarL/FixJ family response regulator